MVLSHSRRGGLTLIELIVVLVILVALAGILVPMLPSMIGRAHTASGAANDSEVTKFVQVYEQLFQQHASGFDLLGDGTTLADYLPATGGLMTPLTLTANQAKALANAGITDLAPMFPTRTALQASGPDASVTFNPYSGSTNTPVAAGLKVAMLDEAAVERILVTDTGGVNGDVYVVVGLGKRSTMVGRVVAQPPVHFGEGANDNAANVYSRFGLVFRVTRGGATPQDLDKAIFLGTISMHDDGFVGTDGHLQEYYNLTKSQ